MCSVCNQRPRQRLVSTSGTRATPKLSGAVGGELLSPGAMGEGAGAAQGRGRSRLSNTSRITTSMSHACSPSGPANSAPPRSRDTRARPRSSEFSFCLSPNVRAVNRGTGSCDQRIKWATAVLGCEDGPAMGDFAFKVNLVAVVRVRADDESGARKVVPTVLGPPGVVEIGLANENNAAKGQNATVTDVDFSIIGSVKPSGAGS